MDMEHYSHREHIHRFAMWAAARATRNLARTEKIIAAIESSGLQEFVTGPSVKQPQFDRLHKQWADKIISELRKHSSQASYGQAAKIIAIYLKVSVIIPNKELSKREVIHAPIDSYFLQNIPKKLKEKLGNIRWTKLTREEYWKLVKKLRSHFGYSDWRLEEYWNISNA